MLENSKYRVGVLLCITGLAISVMTWSWSKAMNDVPLSMRIAMSPGHFQSPKFKTRASTQYRINFAFDSGISTEELDCLIGMNIKSVQPCTNQPAVLNVRWQIFSHGGLIANGSSSELVAASYSNHKIQRHIGFFDAKSGRDYVLALDVLGDETRLDAAHPILEVEPNLNAYEGRLMLNALAFYIGVLVAAISAIVVVIGLLRGGRRVFG